MPLCMTWINGVPPCSEVWRWCGLIALLAVHGMESAELIEPHFWLEWPVFARDTAPCTFSRGSIRSVKKSP